jgi:hypothetical protein
LKAWHEIGLANKQVERVCQSKDFRRRFTREVRWGRLVVGLVPLTILGSGALSIACEISPARKNFSVFDIGWAGPVG